MLPNGGANTTGEGRRRRLVFLGLFQGYLFYTLARRGVVVASHDLQRDLGFTKAEIGLISSSFAAAYGACKFFGGIASDSISCRVLFAAGLVVAAVANVLFAMIPVFLPDSSGRLAVSLSSLCWGLNGAVQGLGWPSLSKILIAWFDKSSRGSVWGLLTMSGNIGNSVAPIVLAWCLRTWSWRAALIVPGFLAAVAAAVAWLTIRDSPAGALPPVGAAASDSKTARHGKMAQCKTTGNQTRNAFWTFVAPRFRFWLLVVSSLLVYFVLKCLSDWTMQMVTEKWEFDAMIAASCATAFARTLR